MTKEQFIEICQIGENMTVEYKTCESEVSHSVYESICSMLNHNGGWIPMYQIGISNGQQFVFAITYASSDEGNVGRNHEMSVENVGRNSKAAEKKNKRQQAIVGLIHANPHITQAQMAEKLDVTVKTIERDTEELASLGIIRYEGEKNQAFGLC